MSSSGLALIPAAGFGTRMGMLPSQSKEMLPDPSNEGKPLIAWCIAAAQDNNLVPLVLVRKEKLDLIRYLEKRKISYRVMSMNHGDEWMDTVLKSADSWWTRNVLILPDTRWDNPSVLNQALNLITDNPLVVGTHSVLDTSKWGAIYNMDGVPFLEEKPSLPIAGEAWGILGFSPDMGHYLFKCFKHRIRASVFNVRTLQLNNFRDLTRTGTLGV